MILKANVKIGGGAGIIFANLSTLMNYFKIYTKNKNIFTISPVFQNLLSI